MSDKPPFDLNPFFFGVIIALLYIIIEKLDDIIELLR
jgi:hypothetical protein